MYLSPKWHNKHASGDLRWSIGSPGPYEGSNAGAYVRSWTSLLGRFRHKNLNVFRGSCSQ